MSTATARFVLIPERWRDIVIVWMVVGYVTPCHHYVTPCHHYVTPRHDQTMVFFFVLDLITFALGVTLFAVDMRTGKRLHKTEVDKWEGLEGEGEPKSKSKSSLADEEGSVNHQE